METYSCAAFCRWILDGLCPIGRFAIGRRTAYRKTRHASDQRQQPLKLRGMGDGYVVAESGDLIADTLKGIAEPSAIDNKATSDGVALGLITDELD